MMRHSDSKEINEQARGKGVETLWLVCWRYKDGRKSGHGAEVSKIKANVAVRLGNLKYPDIHHWVICA